MNIAPTLDLHNQNEFHFADGTDSCGCCCCWRSRPAKVEYKINESQHFVETKSKRESNRKLVEDKLRAMILEKFDEMPEDNEVLFERLKMKIGEDLTGSKPMTEERILKIINAMAELRSELEDKAR
jgi:hypothetical protein